MYMAIQIECHIFQQISLRNGLTRHRNFLTEVIAKHKQYTMERYNEQQRMKIVETFYKNSCSVRACFRALCDVFGPENRPSERTVRRIVNKFKDTGSVCDTVRVRYKSTARSTENIDAVRTSLEDNPDISILRRSRELGLSYGTTWRILHRDLNPNHEIENTLDRRYHFLCDVTLNLDNPLESDDNKESGESVVKVKAPKAVKEAKSAKDDGEKKEVKRSTRGTKTQEPPPPPQKDEKKGKKKDVKQNGVKPEEEKEQTKEVPKKTKRKAPAEKPPASPLKKKKVEEEEIKKGGKKTKEAPAKKKTAAAKEEKPTQNQTTTKWESLDFDNSRKNSKGEKYNLKITSWNVDGIRAWLKKGGLNIIEHDSPDILCLQETKCSDEKLPDEVKDVEGYQHYWCSSEKEGYAGVGVYTKKEPISVVEGIGDDEHDEEGRCLTLEYDQFYLVNVYVPNAGRGLVTLPKRLKFNESFKGYIKKLDDKKPVIVCGDMNVAHNEIDLKNPKSNKKNAGFTQEERDGMTDFLSDGYIDSLREFYPDEENIYTFWSYMSNARAKNVGWRIDYFIYSERIKDCVCDSVVRNEVYGSDHCPITLFIHI